MTKATDNFHINHSFNLYDLQGELIIEAELLNYEGEVLNPNDPFISLASCRYSYGEHSLVFSIVGTDEVDAARKRMIKTAHFYFFDRIVDIT